MSKAQNLTAMGVKKLTDPGIYGDGAGLSLKVTKTGSKSWIFRYMLDGKQTWMGLGAYPEVSLAEARERAADHNKSKRAGLDPLKVKQDRSAAVRAERTKAVITFDKCAEKYIEAFSPSWKNAKHADQWRNTIKTYASPTIGGIDITKIEVHHIVDVLKPIWHTKAETAGRLRGRLERIIGWATAQKYRKGENPARLQDNLEHLLPSQSRQSRIVNHPALHYNEIAGFMSLLSQVEGVSARAVEFAILTGARSGEVRGATWGEINETTGFWTVPSSRMKAQKEHIVPLTSRALEIIVEMKRIKRSDLVFNGRDEGKQLSDMSLTAVLRRMHQDSLDNEGAGWMDRKIGRVITVHGFRSSFRDWVADTTEYPGEMAEIALAHTVGNKVEAAYRRGNMLEKRRGLMQAWADHCCPSKKDEK